MPDAADARPDRPRDRGAAPYAFWIVVAVLLTFGRLFFADFTWWDDQGTIHHNKYLNPPTLETLRYYWTTMSQGLYVPVTYTVWAAVAKLAYLDTADAFGISLNPMLFHGINVLWHAASATLVFLILRRLLEGAQGPAFLGALVFALHPVQVETVGWISGMKDLLCWLGALGVVLLYVRRAQAVRETGAALWRSWELPAAALVLALAILSKPTAMVAPAACVAIDGLAIRRRWVRPALELLPLFAIAAAGAAVARVAQYVGHIGYSPIPYRPLIAGDALCFYLGKLVWPAALSVDYGRTPAAAIADPWLKVRWLVPAAIGVALWLARRRAPLPALAGLIFVIGVAPVLGLAQFQMQWVSTTTDHYLYFSMLGVALAVGWALRRWPGAGLRAGVAVAIAALAARAFVQAGTWQDTFALFEHTMAANPRSTMAYNNMVMAFLHQRDRDVARAEQYADRAIAIAPDDIVTLLNYGVAKSHVRKFDDAARAYEKAWALAATLNVPATMRSSIVEGAIGDLTAAERWAEVARWAERGLTLNPGDKSMQTRLEDARQRAAAATTTRAADVTAAPAPAPASAPSR